MEIYDNMTVLKQVQELAKTQAPTKPIKNAEEEDGSTLLGKRNRKLSDFVDVGSVGSGNESSSMRNSKRPAEEKV